MQFTLLHEVSKLILSVLSLSLSLSLVVLNLDTSILSIPFHLRERERESLLLMESPPSSWWYQFMDCLTEREAETLREHNLHSSSETLSFFANFWSRREKLCKGRIIFEWENLILVHTFSPSFSLFVFSFYFFPSLSLSSVLFHCAFGRVPRIKWAGGFSWSHIDDSLLA